jgi:4-amino-4-deoxychorismate lyase
MAEQSGINVGVVVTLDGKVHDPDVPLLYADDLAAVRGDGIFETLLIRDGRPCLLEAHLNRLAHSADLVDLPAPDATQWRAAVDVAVTSWRAAGGEEGVLRLVYSRGREHGSAPTGYATIGQVPARVADVRRNGLAAVTLERGLAADGIDAMPWLLAGAKTLSYAVNMAALRHAELTPPPWYPILRGTTQQALFEVARNKGFDCDYQALKPADLLAAQGVWLVSSITLGARVHTLDGRALAHAPLADDIADLIDAAIVCDR